MVLVGMWLAPSLGLASEEMSIGDWVVLGDLWDSLRSGGLGGDVEDGLDGPANQFLGDPTDGTDLPGDPDDARDYFRIFCEPGDFVLGYEETLIFGYFWIP